MYLGFFVGVLILTRVCLGGIHIAHTKEHLSDTDIKHVRVLVILNIIFSVVGITMVITQISYTFIVAILAVLSSMLLWSKQIRLAMVRC